MTSLGARIWVILGLGGVALLAHRWLALGWQAWDYTVAGPSARTQLVVDHGRAYVAAGVEGIEVVELIAGKRIVLLPPLAPADRVDDLAIAGEWLFALDATPPGHLTRYRLTQAGPSGQAGSVMPVPVGPFSGVASAGGVVAVSGGTSRLTLRELDRDGSLSAEVGSADYGRGQPDLTLSPDGRMAAISTHLYGPEFAVTFAEILHRPLRLQELGRVELRAAGFTSGGFKPAHFPLVTAWHGGRLYVADGGGLAVIDVSDRARPRELLRDPLSRPAMDLVVAGDEVDVVRAGRRPAVIRYRLDASGRPVAIGSWSPPAGSRVAAIARNGGDLVVTLFERGWQTVPRARFRPIP